MGATHPMPVDVRVVSATNRNLEEEVEAGRFRQDLYYRLTVYPVHLPALRERPEDIVALATHFMERYSDEMGLPATRPLSKGALAALRAHTWPGNIRELENETQRLVIQALGVPAEDTAPVRAEDLSPAVRRATVAGGLGDLPPEGEASLKEMMAEVERALVTRTLERTDGNKTQAAQLLGITREGLHKKLGKLGLT